jgi:CheY-like chemotaxis protein
MRLAVAEIMAEDGLIIDGLSGHLIPQTIDHVLRVCLVADMQFRVVNAIESGVANEKEARRRIREADGDLAGWVNTIFSKQDPWDKELYDIVIPMSSMNADQAQDIISQNLSKEVLRKTNISNTAQGNFLLASRTEAVLCKAGHDVTVEADNGAVRIHINKHVLMLGRLEEELKRIANEIPGVQSVETQVGKDFHEANIYRKHNFEFPSRVLLVDDEREFVQTLSERLQLRDVGSAIVYDGNSALEIIKEDDPEVIIIDLKMPGVNGIDVLKQVKRQRPEIEVIVLTGHGSESDKQECLNLGAFDYLQKPVDIDHLSDVLKKAHENIRKKSQQD